VARDLQTSGDMNLVVLLAALITPAAQAAPCAGSQPCVEDLRNSVGNSNSSTGVLKADLRVASVDLEPDAFSASGLRPEVLALALTAWKKGWVKGDT